MNRLLFEPVLAQTLVETLVERLESAIISGELAPGSRISEQGLARQMGVSRGPLREALRRLEGRRLVERTPNKGPRVASLSRDDLEAILIVREALEGMACRLAAENMTEEDIDGLRDLLRKHAALDGVRRATGYLQEPRDLDFHFRIVKGCGNARLMAILCGDLYDLLRVYRYRSSTIEGRARMAFQEHERIVAAIAARDPEQAEACMREHLRNGRAHATSSFDAASKPSKPEPQPSGKRAAGSSARRQKADPATAPLRAVRVPS